MARRILFLVRRHACVLCLWAAAMFAPTVVFAQVPEPATQPEAMLNLPRDLSPLGMFLAADIVVKVVMLGLIFASVLAWTIWFAKTIEIVNARRQLRTTAEVLGKAISLAGCIGELSKHNDTTDRVCPCSRDRIWLVGRFSRSVWREGTHRLAPGAT